MRAGGVTLSQTSEVCTVMPPSDDITPPAEPLRTLSGGFSWRLPEFSFPLTSEVGPGLQGVVACASRVSWLDPEAGVLAYRGVPVERLAGSASFEQVTRLLISGHRPGEHPAAEKAFARELRGSRALPPDVVGLLRSLDPSVHPVRLLRAGVSALGCHELSLDDELSGAAQWRQLRIVGQVTALVAEIARIRRGAAPGRLDEPECSLACSLLRGMGHAPVDPADEALLDLLWLLYADHGLDAPSFTSMVVASCHADPYYNVVAGLSALLGHRLGGATEAVLGLLLPLKGGEQARQAVRDLVERGERVPGFGHRLYRMADPRAVVLRRELSLAARRLGRPELFEVARAAEEEASRLLGARGVHVNINFYAAPLFHLLGADPALSSCLYAVGRMAGLVARVREVLDGGRLYRPRTRYVEQDEEVAR